VILRADAQRLPLADECAQVCVTSPPYFGLRAYSTDGACDAVWPDGWRGELGHEPDPRSYVEHLVGIFREVKRVLRRDGCCFVVMGDSYASGHVAGGSRTQHRAGIPGPNSTLEAPRVTCPPGMKPKDLIGVPWMLAFALRDDGWWLRQDVIWAKDNPMPESVRDRCTRAHEYIFMLTKASRYYYDADAVAEPIAEGTPARLSQPDLDSQQGGYKVELYQEGFPGRKQRDRKPADILRAMRDSGKVTRNLRSVWRINTKPYPKAHFATFAPELARRCIVAGSRKGDVVLDPFCGSGTTVEVAWANGRVGIGCDLVWSYCHEHAARRLHRGVAAGSQEAMAL